MEQSSQTLRTRRRPPSGLLSSSLSAGASEAHSVAPTTEGEESEGSGDYDSEELEEIFSIDEWLKDLDHNEIKHTAKIEHKKRERRDRFPRLVQPPLSLSPLSVKLTLVLKGSRSRALNSPKSVSARPSSPPAERDEQARTGKQQPRPRSLPRPLSPQQQLLQQTSAKHAVSSDATRRIPTINASAASASAAVTTETTATATTSTSSASPSPSSKRPTLRDVVEGGHDRSGPAAAARGARHGEEEEVDDYDDDLVEHPYVTKKRTSSFTAFLTPRRRAHTLSDDSHPGVAKVEPSPSRQHQESLWRRSITLMGWKSPRNHHKQQRQQQARSPRRGSDDDDDHHYGIYSEPPADECARDQKVEGREKEDGGDDHHRHQQHQQDTAGSGKYDRRRKKKQRAEGEESAAEEKKNEDSDEAGQGDGFWRRNSRRLSLLIKSPRRRNHNTSAAAVAVASGRMEHAERTAQARELQRRRDTEVDEASASSIYLRMQLDFEARLAARPPTPSHSPRDGDGIDSGDAWTIDHQFADQLRVHNPHQQQQQGGDDGKELIALESGRHYGRRRSSTVMYSPRPATTSLMAGRAMELAASQAAISVIAATTTASQAAAAREECGDEGEEGPAVPADDAPHTSSHSSRSDEVVATFEARTSKAKKKQKRREERKAKKEVVEEERGQKTKRRMSGEEEASSGRTPAPSPGWRNRVRRMFSRSGGRESGKDHKTG